MLNILYYVILDAEDAGASLTTSIQSSNLLRLWEAINATGIVGELHKEVNDRQAQDCLANVLDVAVPGEVDGLVFLKFFVLRRQTFCHGMGCFRHLRESREYVYNSVQSANLQ